MCFPSILPISLQQIEYEKLHAVHSNELVKSYTMKPMTIYIDKYLGGDIAKLVVFSLLVYKSTILPLIQVEGGWLGGWGRGGGGPLYYNQIDEGSNVVQ